MKVELELTAEQLNEIKTKYSLTEKTSKGRLKPKLYDVYWNIGGCGEIWEHEWAHTCYDNYCYATGNYYCSEAEAGFAKQKQLITQELKDFALAHNESKIDWFDGLPKFHLVAHYVYQNKSVVIEIARSFTYKDDMYKSKDSYFKLENIAQQAIDAIGKERLMKYYFGEWEEQ